MAKRIELLGDLKRLGDELKKERKDRSPSDVKRLQQLGAERANSDLSLLERLFLLDTSKGAVSLRELLDSYYQELVELEEKDKNLGVQRQEVDQLLDLTRRETELLQKALLLLRDLIAEFESAQETEFVLARARIHPEMADRILDRFQNRTDRLLLKPFPFALKERAKKIEEMAESLFDRQMGLEAARHWESVLLSRLNSQEIRKEAAAHEDRLLRINTNLGRNQRREYALTGNKPPTSAFAVDGDESEAPMEPGGAIGKQRRASPPSATRP